MKATLIAHKLNQFSTEDSWDGGRRMFRTDEVEVVVYPECDIYTEGENIPENSIVISIDGNEYLVSASNLIMAIRMAGDN